MHGQIKSQATYSYGENLSVASSPTPVSKLEYYYKTSGNFNPSGPNYLSNQVYVLTGDADSTLMRIGETYDVVADIRENSTHTESYGGLFNIDLVPFIPIPSGTPDIENTDEVFRTAVINKIVYRSGILESVRSTTDGSSVLTKNLLYDIHNGAALLSCKNNEHDRPVYSYNFSSTWYYPAMGPGYQNYRVNISGTSDFDQYLTLGDYVYANYSYWWVDGFDQTSGEPILKDKDDNLPQQPINYPIKVMKSGFRNQQSIMAGNLVSLTNPVTGKYFPLETAFNDNATWTTHGSFSLSGNIIYYAVFNILDCNGRTIPVSICTQGTNDLKICSNVSDSTCEGNCRCSVYLQGFFSSAMTSRDLTNYYIHLKGNDLKIWDNLGHTNIIPWEDQYGCFNQCLEDVLNSEAYEFSDVVTYDWDDAGKDQAWANYNDYFVGEKGIWRMVRSNVFLVDRKQTGPNASFTRANKDGVYSFYNYFNWTQSTGNSNNEQYPWAWTESTTKYSPYGMELENKNALNVYSAALYGYRNALATAVSNNARYYETAFDGFEDYITGNASYAHGHFKYTTTGLIGKITSTKSHTGIKSVFLYGSDILSMEIPVQAQSTAYVAQGLKLIEQKRYVMTFWVYPNGGTIKVSLNTSTDLPYIISDAIEGWQRIEVEFSVPSPADVKIEIYNTASMQNPPDYYVDDLRLLPFNSRMKCFVYNEKNQKLTAELDENHYASFYNYDEQGQLIQVKKETARGIMTIKTTRNNTSRR